MTTVLLGRICRTCLRKANDMHKLRDFIIDDLKIEDVLNQTIPDFDLDVEDMPLPVEICKDCLKLKVILNQQEQERCQEEPKLNIEPIEYLDERDIVDDLKNEENSDNLNGSHRQSLVTEDGSADHKTEACLQTHQEGSSDEYWPNDDKEDSDSYFFEKMAKLPFGKKAKRKYQRRVPLKVADPITCLHCNKVFAKRNLLTKHLSVHDSENKFICDICDYRFSSETKLRAHVNCRHTSAEVSSYDGPYPCPDCPMIFQQKRAMAAHCVIHSEQEFKCEVCDMGLKTKAAVTRHMNCKHPDILPYKCHICDKSFPVETHLNDHINEHMGYKKYKCDFCEKSFPNTTVLRDHVRVHTGESPFLCSDCGKSFKTANVLRQHLQRHGEKKFHCSECPMKFYAKMNLTKHMTSHTKLKSHVCDICGSAFTRQDSLKAHKFKHTGQRPFKCEDCSMSFVFKRLLNRHKLTHTGEKPHRCTFCDRAYAASGDLVKHLRTHVGEKTYFCDQCPESFKYAIDLKDHKNLHYKEKLNLEKQKEITVEILNQDIEIEQEDTVIILEEFYEAEQNSRKCRMTSTDS